jgi:DNA invertase Pin-like site-specific DNA recombinase
VPIEPELADALARIGRERHPRRDEERDLIRRAHSQGGGIREIARLVNLSHTHVARIVEGQEEDRDEP